MQNQTLDQLEAEYIEQVDTFAQIAETYRAEGLEAVLPLVEDIELIDCTLEEFLEDVAAQYPAADAEAR